jgi:hypothetical protein
MHHSSGRIALGGSLVLATLIALPSATGQVIGRNYPADMAPPPVTWKGLVPGRDKLDEAAIERIGKADEPLDWYSAIKYEFKVPNRPDVTDNVLTRHDKVVGTIEAVTPIEGCETVDGVRARLGNPEHTIILSRQRILDYAGKGFRFIANNADGRIVGTATFPPRRRVPEGEIKVLDLSRQQQGPLPTTGNAQPWDGLKVGFASASFGLNEDMIKGLMKDDQKRKPHDVLQARCCYIRYGDQSVALIGADLYGMLRLNFAPVFKRLAAEGHPNVVVGMSHSHAAPDTIFTYGIVENAYLRSIQEALYTCVTDAAKAAQPAAQVKFTSVELPLDGARVAGISRNVRNPGLVPPQLAVITFHAADNKVLGTLINYACHAEVLDGEKYGLFSSDFVGPLRDYVDKALGGTSVFLNAALGGMVTGDTPSRRPEDIKLLGDKLGQCVVDSARKAQPTAEHTLRFIKRPIEVPPTNPKFKTMAAAQAKHLVGGRIPTELNYVRLGSAEFITIPGELFPELGFEVQARMTGYPRMIVCLANEELGYIVPGYDFNDRVYEEGMSVGAAMGPMIEMAAWELAAQGAKPAEKP